MTGDWRSIPNLVTLSRAGLFAPLSYCILAGRPRAALFIFALGSLTDLLDGLLARLLRQITPLGAFLDPAVDKLFFMGTALMLTAQGFLPGWFGATLVVRDAAVVMISVVTVRHAGLASIRPHLTGKASVAMLVVVTSWSLVTAAFDLDGGVAFDGALVLTAALSVLSGAIYAIRFLKRRPEWM